MHNLHYEKFQDGTVKCIEDEIPFDVPTGWALCRLNDMISLMTDYVANGSFKTLRENVTTYKEPNYALFIRTVDFSNNFKGDLSYIDKKSYDFLAKSQLHGGELMLSNIGASIGKIFRIPHFDMPMSLAPNSIIVKFHDEETYDYFECMFKSFVGQDFLHNLTAGTAMPKFSKTELKQMVVPIAPLKEQVRISNECNKLLSVVDSMESNREDLSELIALSKSKILDLAIRGKLVTQNPNDEPASILLERIRTEKEELIKQGKLKRDKKESVIYKGDDNSYYEQCNKKNELINDCLPFDIPDTWTWCRLGNICTEILYGLNNSAELSGTLRFLRITDIQNGKVNWNAVPFTTVENNEKYLLKENDIVFARTGATVGKSFLIKSIPVASVFASYLIRIRLLPGVDAQYIYNFFNSPFYWQQITDKSVGVGQPNCNGTLLQELLIPLPPLNEQTRINYTISKYNLIFSNVEANLI